MGLEARGGCSPTAASSASPTSPTPWARWRQSRASMPTSVGQAVPGGCRLLQDMAVSPLKRFSTAAPDVPRQGDRV
jgi:hypothetical protein